MLTPFSIHTLNNRIKDGSLITLASEQTQMVAARPPQTSSLMPPETYENGTHESAPQPPSPPPVSSLTPQQQNTSNTFQPDTNFVANNQFIPPSMDLADFAYEQLIGPENADIQDIGRLSGSFEGLDFGFDRAGTISPTPHHHIPDKFCASYALSLIMLIINVN